MDAPIKTTSPRSNRPGSKWPDHSQQIRSRKEQTMNKSLNVILAALVAGGASLAVAQSSAAIPLTRAQQFASELKVLQDESTAMPIGSPPVDKNAKAEDPIPPVTTLAQQEAWFKVENQRLQRESTAMPPGSPAVNKHELAADPLPKATTPAQMAADNAAEAQFLRQKSTR
jgi:hypothetical protein